MKEDVKRFIEDVWQAHRGKTVGLVLGLLLGIAILLIGFWKTVFVLFCGIIGLAVGIRVDRDDDLTRNVGKWLPPFFRR